MFKESEKFRVGHKFGIPAAAALFAAIKVMPEAAGPFLTHLDLVHQVPAIA